MRPGAGFNATAMVAAAAPAVAGGAHSAWHSPVPYLFGGLAAMLGLIAFALLILACSYWKLSGYLGGSGGDGEAAASAASGGLEKPTSTAAVVPIYEEKVVVIMAGDEKPTFLATPISSQASSFGEHGNGDGGDEKKKVEEATETQKETQDLDHN